MQELREIVTSPDKDLYECLEEIIKEDYYIHSVVPDTIKKYGYEACYLVIVSKIRENKSFKKK